MILFGLRHIFILCQHASSPEALQMVLRSTEFTPVPELRLDICRGGLCRQSLRTPGPWS